MRGLRRRRTRRSGQAIVVVVDRAATAGALDVDALLAECREQHARLHGAGAASSRAGPLPRNPNGKIDRKSLAAECRSAPHGSRRA